MRIFIAAPYFEQSVVELAKGAHARHSLASFVTPDTRVIRSVGAIFERVGPRDLGRRLSRSKPSFPVVYVCPTFEAQRLIAKALRHDTVHRLKDRFDVVASRSGLNNADVVLGMPESCERLFASAPHATKVFHAVDGHPLARNKVLDEVYGFQLAAAEKHEDQAVDRILRELELANVVIVPSHVSATHFQDSEHATKSILIHPYAVNADRFVVPNESPTRNARPRVLYVGQVSYRKGIPFLVDAARKMNLDVTIAGPLVAPEIVASLPSNVEYVGTLSQKRVAQTMATADAFVFPTLEDSFGFVVTEAAAAGLPIHSTRAAGATELLSEGSLHIFDVGSVPSLRESLGQVHPLSIDERVANQSAFLASQPIQSWAAWSDALLSNLSHQGTFE